MPISNPYCGNKYSKIRLDIQQRKYQLSDLVDGVIVADDLTQLLNSLDNDPELRKLWMRYNLIGQIMRKEPLNFRAVDIADKVRNELGFVYNHEQLKLTPKFNLLTSINKSCATVTSRLSALFANIRYAWPNLQSRGAWVGILPALAISIMVWLHTDWYSNNNPHTTGVENLAPVSTEQILPVAYHVPNQESEQASKLDLLVATHHQLQIIDNTEITDYPQFMNISGQAGFSGIALQSKPVLSVNNNLVNRIVPFTKVLPDLAYIQHINSYTPLLRYARSDIADLNLKTPYSVDFTTAIPTDGTGSAKSMLRSLTSNQGISCPVMFGDARSKDNMKSIFWYANNHTHIDPEAMETLNVKQTSSGTPPIKRLLFFDNVTQTSVYLESGTNDNRRGHKQRGTLNIWQEYRSGYKIIAVGTIAKNRLRNVVDSLALQLVDAEP
ncbi:hypothetical protein TI04_01350 [Achromatium sp. WMS2]|nr:hypothetical protein TI04_01350 [Achromatium sp. WMS2]